MAYRYRRFMDAGSAGIVPVFFDGNSRTRDGITSLTTEEYQGICSRISREDLNSLGYEADKRGRYVMSEEEFDQLAILSGYERMEEEN